MKLYQGAVLAALLCVTHGLAAYAGYFYVNRERNRVALVVNGEVATRRELDLALTPYRELAVRDLASQKVVRQAAAKLGVSVPDKELPQIRLTKLDPDLTLAVANRERTALLLRKVIAKDCPPEDKRKFYELFSDELKKYRLDVLVLAEGCDITRLRAELDRGLSFDQLKSKFGSAQMLALTTSYSLTQGEMQLLLGPKGVDSVLKLKQGELLGPVGSAVGPLILRYKGAIEDYASLEPDIDRLIVDGRLNLYNHVLGADSAVLPELAMVYNGPDKGKGAGVKTDGLPKPAKTPAPHVQLPPLQEGDPIPIRPMNVPTATPAPLPELPSPKDESGTR